MWSGFKTFKKEKRNVWQLEVRRYFGGRYGSPPGVSAFHRKTTPFEHEGVANVPNAVLKRLKKKNETFGGWR